MIPDKGVEILDSSEVAAVGFHEWYCGIEKSLFFEFSLIRYLLDISLFLGFWVDNVEWRIAESQQRQVASELICAIYEAGCRLLVQYSTVNTDDL